MKATLKVLTVMALAMVVSATSAQAAVYGQNQYLEDHDGKVFIPMKPSTSGVLGDFNGKRIIGSKPDTVVLSQGQSSGGYLIYDLNFDLSADLNPSSGEPTPLTSADIDTSQPFWLTITLYDIEFEPIMGGGTGRKYFETLHMEFIQEQYAVGSAGGSEGYGETSSPQLTIDASNYGNFRADGFGETNNQQVDYKINLLDTEGINLTDNDLDQMLSNMGFTLRITLTTYLEQYGPGRYQYTNRKEYLGDYSTNNGVGGGEFDTNALEFTVIPEPATLSLFTLTSLVLLRRRK